MTLAMAGFAFEDLFLKLAAARVPTGEVVLIEGLAGATVFMLMSHARRERMLPAVFLAPRMIARSAFEIAGRLFYALAIALTPLATTSAILQATPLVVIAGAAILFRERVGWRRWLAVLAGLVGVVIILDPGAEGFSALSLLAVAGTLGFSGRDLATRAAPRMMSNRQLGTLGFLVLAISGAIIMLFDVPPALPDSRAALFIIGCTVFGVAGYHALTAAMRTGAVAAVTPFRYTRLLFAIILAMLFVGERLDAAMIAGSLLIIGSGLYGLRSRK